MAGLMFLSASLRRCSFCSCPPTGLGADVNLVAPCVQRLKASGLPVTKLWADRAMFSAAYEALLAVNGMNNGLWS